MPVDAVMLAPNDHGRLLTFLTRIVGRDEAEDVAQEAYLRAHRHADKFDGACAYRSWVFTLARNVAFDALRRAKRRPLGHAEPLMDGQFVTPSDGRLLRFELSQQLRRLPAKEALVVSALLNTGSYKDAAAHLGWPVAKFKSRLFRIRERWLRHHAD